MPKLTLEDAVEMRELFESTKDLGEPGLYHPDKWTYKRLMGKFNCSRDTVWKTLTWQRHYQGLV